MLRELLIESKSKSTCLKHPIGCVIETRFGEYVYGWNGPPGGLEHEACLRQGLKSGEKDYLCVAVHAERRAISHAARYGASIREGTLYLSEWFPCSDCAKSIIEAGIIKIVTPDEFLNSEGLLIEQLRDSPYNFEQSEYLLRACGVKLVVDESLKGL